MTTLKKSLLNGAALVAVASLVGCAEFSIKKLENTTPAGSAFSNSLAEQYLGHSKEELDVHVDDMDAYHFAKKGLAAAGGEEVAPDMPADRNLDDMSRPVLERAHARLVHALDNGGRTKFPELAAHAQDRYDCWLEQQEENFQHTHIRKCRLEFFKAVRELEYKLDLDNRDFDAKIVEPDFVIHYGLGKSKITKKQHYDVLHKAADAYKETVKDIHNPTNRVYVYGFTDMIGGKALNKRLSQRRADEAKRQLVRHGVPKDMIDAEGKGQIQGPRVAKENRKVVIEVDNH